MYLRRLSFFPLILALLLGSFSQAQRVEWLDQPIDRTQTLSLDLAFGDQVTLITKIAAADLEIRALATHSLELVDGTVMAAILRTQPQVTFANSGGAFASWQTDTRVFQALGQVEEDDFAITLSMPEVEGADFVPDVKVEMILRPLAPEAGGVSFLETASLSPEVRGAQDYGLADFQAATRYPQADIASLVTLRDLPSLSMARQGGRCANTSFVRSVYATVADLDSGAIADLSNFPQECWRSKEDGLKAADVEGDEAYQPDIRVRLEENGGEVVGFVFGADTAQAQQIYVQNTSSGWLYGIGDGNWDRISNGSWLPVPFGNGILAIRNPRGGETADATENDAFISYLLNE